MKHEAPHYAIFSSLMLLLTSYAQIPSSAICSYILLVHILPCQIPTLTPIQNNRCNCNSVYFNLYIFTEKIGRKNFLDPKAEGKT